MEARAGGAGHWRRWNGAEWNRLELAKSGPSAADVSLEAASYQGEQIPDFCTFKKAP